MHPGGRKYMHVRIIGMVVNYQAAMGARDRDIYKCPAFGPDHRVCMTEEHSAGWY